MRQVRAGGVANYTTASHQLLALTRLSLTSCQTDYYHDSFSAACKECAEIGSAAPLIVLGVVLALIGLVVGCNYTRAMKYFKERKEHIFMEMNEATIVVSEGTARKPSRFPARSHTPTPLHPRLRAPWRSRPRRAAPRAPSLLTAVRASAVQPRPSARTHPARSPPPRPRP